MSLIESLKDVILSGGEISEEQAYALFPAGVEQHEVDAGDEHYHDEDAHHIIGVPEGYPFVVSGESACGDGSEGLTYTVEEVHRSEPQQQYAHRCQRGIYAPDGEHCLADARVQLAVDHTGGFGVEYGDAGGLVQFGEHGQHEEDNPQAANPLGEGTPEEDAVRLRVDVGDDAGVAIDDLFPGGG